MSLLRTLPFAVLLVTAASVTPTLAEPGKGHGKSGHAHAQHCPPGLAKKSPSCVPPGQARKHDRHDDRRYGRAVGDRLRVGDYVLVQDPRRYDLPQRDDWRYYRDGGQVYRVDPDTQRILAILNLAQAFLN